MAAEINLAIPTFALVGTIIGPESLTAVFGMGTGVSPAPWAPMTLDNIYHPAVIDANVCGCTLYHVKDERGVMINTNY